MIGIIKRLYNEIVKNLKLMFRNWVSLSLLIIAPLVLILLIGYAFSGDELSDLKIGIISNDSIDISLLTQNISSYAEIVSYLSIDDCVSDLVLSKNHLCIILEGSENQESSLSRVVYFYDNSRKKMSLVIVREIQDYFGIEAEQMSLESAKNIIGNLQELVIFITDRKSDIGKIKNESFNIRDDLISRREQLVDVRDDFLPSYIKIKLIQEDIHNYSSELSNMTFELDDKIEDFKDSLELFYKYFNDSIFTVEDEIEGIIYTNITLYNETENVTDMIIDNVSIGNFTENLTVNLTNVTDLMIDDLDIISAILNSTNNEINLSVEMIDAVIQKLDNIKFLLDDEIARTDEYIIKINKSVLEIDRISSQLDEKIGLLSGVNPQMADRLVKPFSYEYVSLLKGATNVQVSFPFVLVIIIMFISLLFSNISTLMEIHSKAYFRNLISPVNDLIYAFGVFFTSILVIFLQILVLFSVAQTNFGVSVASSFLPAVFITVLLISIFVLFGMLFAYVFSNVSSSILITTFSALLIFLFSNALSPIEAMPEFARFFAQNNPVVLGEFLFRQILLFKTPLSLLMPQILVLVSYIIILLTCVMIVAKVRNKQR